MMQGRVSSTCQYYYYPHQHFIALAYCEHFHIGYAFKCAVPVYKCLYGSRLVSDSVLPRLHH